MSRRPLENSAWGFESNCFVCEATNPDGLQIPFFENDGVVEAEFTLSERFSGAPRLVHGGIVLAVLDEAMAWATIALGGSFAVTRTTTANFERPVRVGRTYRVEAAVDAQDAQGLSTSGRVLDDKGRTCAEASARFISLSGADAPSAIGRVEGQDRRFLRGSGD